MQIANGAAFSYESYTLNFKLKSGEGGESGNNTPFDDDTLKQIKSGEITGKSISDSYLMEFTVRVQKISISSFGSQGVSQNIDKIKEMLDQLGDLSDIGYSGKKLSELNQDEAKELVSEDGFFGIAKTAERISGFVLSGGGSDFEKLKAGREGVMRGFKEAEAVWGEQLPQIAYDTLSKALEQIDKKIEALGGKALDVQG